MSDPLADLLARWTPEARIVCFTGAGLSKASGVPTFRGTDGLWRRFRAEDLATPQAFRRDPTTSWEWYDWRRQLIAACAPNPAHGVIASWSRRFPRLTTITQNVDGLHERAGTERVLRLHGSIWEVRCARPCRAGAEPVVNLAVPISPLPPRCPHCHGLLRPGVVWFGEALDARVMSAARAAAASADIFLTIGTSSVVHPAAGLVLVARDGGAFTVEINPEETALSSVADLVIRAPAETALPDIDRRVFGALPPV